MTDAPQLLVDWSSPWHEFCSAIAPALKRSPPRLSLETRAGLFPFRGILVTMLLEIAALAAAMVPANAVQPVALQSPRPTRDIIYFSADELPRTQDLAGAVSGSHGQRGGAAIHHPTQVIKVARDEVLREKVTDAPQLNLPKSDSRLSNLLAYRADAGPAPAEALPLKRQVPLMPDAVAPPRPEILRSELRPMQLATPAVVSPPVELPRENSARQTLPLVTTVVPPPVSAPVQATNRAAQLTLPREAVVAPPPEMSGVTHSRQRSAEFVPRVVPPPVDLGAVRTPAAAVALNGKQTAVPPPVELQDLRQNVRQVLGNTAAVPPTVDISSVRQQRTVAVAGVAVIPPAASSSDTGRKYSGGAAEKTSPVSSGTGVVVSPRPGDKPGLPANSEKATLAMSPSGSSSLGAGGDGGGSGVSHGSGSGNAASGANSGAASAGTGKGASPVNRTGNSPYPGPGGAGNLSNGTPRVPGVSVSGGNNNVVTLPSFGGTPDPHASGHSTVAKPTSNAVTVVASPRSGGATNLYGALKGDRVYTIYIQTAIGTAVMQFADPTSAAHPYDTDLSAPQAIRVDLPSDLERSRLLIACVLDRNGVLKHWRVLQSDSHDFSTKVLSALPDWKFSPALRGEETVEVNAILGFGVDTK